MNPITFPGLGLTFSIERVAFSILGKPVYWYGIIIAAGLLLAVAFCCRQAPRFGITTDDVMDMLLFAVPLSVVGARAYYVIFYWSLYNIDGVPQWGDIIAVWDGGLAIYGGVIMAFLTVYFVSRYKKIKPAAFFDLGVMGLFIGQAVGRWGNFVNQEAYGSECSLPWRMGLIVDGTYTEVHPTFLYESLWNLVGLALLVLILYRFRKFDGQMTLTYLAWYGLGRTWIEGLRTDSLYFFGLEWFGVPIRTSQLLAAASCVVSVALLVYQLRFRRHTPDALYVNRKQNEQEENHVRDDH